MRSDREVLTESADNLEVHKIIGWGTRAARPSKKLTRQIEALHSMEFDTLVLWCLQRAPLLRRASPESTSDLALLKARGSSPWRVHCVGVGAFPFSRGLVLTSFERHDDPIDRVEEHAFTGARNRWSPLPGRPDPPPLSVVALSIFLDVPPSELQPVIAAWWTPIALQLQEGKR